MLLQFAQGLTWFNLIAPPLCILAWWSDRYFLSQVANKIVDIHEGQLRLFRGDHHYYLDKVAAEKEQEKLEAIEAEKAAKAEAKRNKQKEKSKKTAKT